MSWSGNASPPVKDDDDDDHHHQQQQHGHHPSSHCEGWALPQAAMPLSVSLSQSRTWTQQLQLQLQLQKTRTKMKMKTKIKIKIPVMEMELPRFGIALGMVSLLAVGFCLWVAVRWGRFRESGSFRKRRQRQQQRRRQGKGRSTNGFQKSAMTTTHAHHGNSSRCRRLARKKDFLSRVGDDYGYGGSDLGHIDDWRPTELPALQFPVGHESDDHDHDHDHDDHDGDGDDDE